MTEQYRTIQARCRHEIDKIKGSRFIGTALPLTTPEGVAPVRVELRKEFPKANHHCYAWRCGVDAKQFKSSDDGEPGGSAGRPILAQIDSRDLTDILVVVSRIFGGTKLGVGGLVRAYSIAAAETLEQSSIETVTITERISVTFPYDATNTIKAWLVHWDVTPAQRSYTDQVSLLIDVAKGRGEELLKDLTERSGNRVTGVVLPEGSP